QCEAMKTGHRHYTVKALINTSSRANKISRSIADRLEKKYGNLYKNKKVKNSLGYQKIMQSASQPCRSYIRLNMATTS
ncbi:5486_t:CDS:2, partial [Funneliformis geosporum]